VKFLLSVKSTTLELSSYYHYTHATLVTLEEYPLLNVHTTRNGFLNEYTKSDEGNPSQKHKSAAQAVVLEWLLISGDDTSDETEYKKLFITHYVFEQQHLKPILKIETIALSCFLLLLFLLASFHRRKLTF